MFRIDSWGQGEKEEAEGQAGGFQQSTWRMVVAQTCKLVVEVGISWIYGAGKNAEIFRQIGYMV